MFPQHARRFDASRQLGQKVEHLGLNHVDMRVVIEAVMLDADTGYIKVEQFGENTDPELGRALADLTKKGMKRLHMV